MIWFLAVLFLLLSCLVIVYLTAPCKTATQLLVHHRATSFNTLRLLACYQRQPEGRITGQAAGVQGCMP